MTSDPADKETLVIKPVFIHGGYRTATTWLWTKFRAHSDFQCFYEIFNEQLAGIRRSDIGRNSPSQWRSRHPDTSAYMLEFANLISSDGGVPSFPVENPPQCRAIGAQGIDGPLDPDVERYVDHLIRAAGRAGRRPVLSCTGLLGRTAGLRQAFGGTHILIKRNPFHQWCSITGQARFGNDWFLRQFYHSMSLADSDEFIKFISSFFNVNEKFSADKWLSSENSDKVFCYTVALSIYLLMKSRHSCDFIVDINDISEKEYARSETSKAISQIVGADIDLGDARIKLDYPVRMLHSVAECQSILQEMLNKIYDLSNTDQDDINFIGIMMSDVWAEHDRFMSYTNGAAEALVESERAVSSLKKVREELSDTIKRLGTDINDATAQILAAEERANEIEAELTAQTAIFAERERTTTQLVAESEHRAVMADAARNSIASDLIEAKRMVADSESKLRQKQEECSQAWAEIEALSTTIKQLETELASLRDERDRLVIRLEDEKSWTFRLAGERTAHAQESAHAAYRVATANAKAKKALALANAAEKALETERARYSAAIALIDKMHSEIADIRGQLDTRPAPVQHASGDKQTLVAELVTLTQKLVDQTRRVGVAESALLVEHENAKWQAMVTAIIIGHPWWWALMPKTWRECQLAAQLSHKGLFDSDAYLKRYPDVAASGMTALNHYLRHGLGEGRQR